jgi:hypothetical protein
MKKKSLFNLTFPNVLFALMWLPTTASAQDILVTENGDAIKAWQVDMGGSKIYYRDGEGENAALKSIDKSSVLVWKKADGSRVVVDKNGESTATATPVQQASEPQVMNDENSRRANDEAVKRIKAINVQYIGESSKKDANILYCQCALLPNSTIADSKVEMVFHSSVSQYNGAEKLIPVDNVLQVIIKNKSNKTIYVDLGNTIMMRGTESIPCWVPSSTSSTHGSTAGVGVNMGAVAKAAGIGGAAGTIANGVNVGTSSTNFSTTTTYAQRVVPIPPLSERVLGNMALFQKSNPNLYKIQSEIYTSFSIANLLNIFLPSDMIPAIGEVKNYDNGEDLRFGTYLTYADDENQTQPYTLNASFGLSKIVGLKARKFVTDKYLDSSQLTSNAFDAIYFVAYPKEGASPKRRGRGLTGSLLK